MSRRFRTGAVIVVITFLSGFAASRAARPIVDYHRLDAYFSLFAPDSNVPWKMATVRLDTYTDAPVEFAAYSADPADVVVAGSNSRPRPIDMRGRKPVAAWRYSPPSGYRFQSNDVGVPIGSREGFFVIEARRGDVAEQVWINRTRIALLTKETAAAITLYGTDLGTGKPLPHLHVAFVVERRLVDRFSDAGGIIRWTSSTRPVFALANRGGSFAFVSFLPQAPPARTILTVKTDSAVVRAGGTVQTVGFARTRAGTALRPADGNVRVSLQSRSGIVASATARLDRAGAFASALPVPPDAPAGDYTIIASLQNATAGTGVHVEAEVAGLSLAVTPGCEPCNAGSDVPLAVHAIRNGTAAAGVAVDVNVIRSPHVFQESPSVQPAWGMAPWYATRAETDQSGNATILIPRPDDGLASTYGVHAEAGGATADTRIAVPTAAVVLNVMLDRMQIGGGTPAAFEIFGADFATGKAAAQLSVRVQLIHGSTIQQQTVVLNERGEARGAFSAPETGSNLIVASAQTPSGDVVDAAQLQVEPQTMQVQTAGSDIVTVALDRDRYTPGQDIHVEARAAGAYGTALFTIENARDTQVRAAPVRNGSAAISFRATDGPGTLQAGAAVVRDGALEWNATPIVLDGPGRPVPASIGLDRTRYSPGGAAAAQLVGVRPGSGTIVVRLTKGVPTGSAAFDDAPGLLAIGATATQSSAPAGASWHPWVDSSGAHSQLQAFARRGVPPPDLTMSEADASTLYWKIGRTNTDSVVIPVPESPGTYVISLMKIDDDGRVTAASSRLIVQ